MSRIWGFGHFLRRESSIDAWTAKQIPGKGKLTDIINETHENSRYLPQMILPDNLVAVPSLVDVVKVGDARVGAPEPSKLGNIQTDVRCLSISCRTPP